MTTEQLAPANQDPMRDSMNEARSFFANEFGLDIDATGQFSERPTGDQLDALASWREATFGGGIEMADTPTFARKVLLAQALMPQRDSDGAITYLFGKGCGAEIALQGQVAGRQKILSEVPYRTHADFEIYAFDQDNPPAGYDDFGHVFGGQEIYPVTQTKGLKKLDPSYLKDTADTVDLGGIPLLVPRLEAQFVDKVEKGHENTERRLRGHTDAELLAAAYDLDRAHVHDLVEHNVIDPAREAFKPEGQLRRLRRNAVILGPESADSATVSVGPDTTFELSDYGLGHALLEMGPEQAAAHIAEAGEQVLAQKHDFADQQLVAGQNIRPQIS